MKSKQLGISFAKEIFVAMVVILLLVAMAMVFYLSLPLTPAPTVIYPNIAYNATKCPGCTKSTPPILVKYKFEDLIKKKKDR